MVLLTWLTAALVIMVFLVLAFGLVKISNALRAIGGTPTSYLAKLRFGLRAIDTETSHLAPQVTRLNSGLGHVGESLGEVDRHLGSTLDAVKQQEG